MKREDIYSLNLHCLLLLRDCARKDVSEACYRFGCDLDFVNEVCAMSMEALGALAQSDAILFKLKYKPAELRKTIQTEPQFRSLLLEGLSHAPA